MICPDKERFIDKFGYDFDSLRKETINWLQSQDLAGYSFTLPDVIKIGSGGIAIAPANAGFLQWDFRCSNAHYPVKDLPLDFSIDSVFTLPTFRHTHFNGKQIVVHKRSENLHEIFSYNLYPGPSAKKDCMGFYYQKAKKKDG